VKIRKITSLTATLAFIGMVATSVILFVVPQGRVAYWADWRLLGLTKTHWGNIHINLGFLFLCTLGLHIYYNWRPLMSYLKNKMKKIKVFTPEFNVAMVITVVFVAGTYLSVPPFSMILDLNDHFKDTGAEKYGEPPYGHAELSSLKTFANKMNLDLEKSMELLNQAGYTLNTSETTLEAIGRQYNVPPQLIYETIKPATIESAPNAKSTAMLPDTPPPGTGSIILADFCAQFDLNMKLIIRELKKQDIAASEELTLKTIAEKNNTSPIEIYEKIKIIVQSN
jgi:hypothetical protein